MSNYDTSPANLEAIYGVGNPEAYNQGRLQVGLDNMMQDQGMQQAQQKTQADTLANQFTAQNNPIKLQQSQANLETTQNDNTLSGVKSRISAQTEGAQLDNAKLQQVLNASDIQIKTMASQAQQMAYSDDPAIAAKGKQLMQLSQAAVEARQKHADDMEKEDIIRKSAERVAAGNNAATISAASINANSRLGVAGLRQGLNKTVEQQLSAAKNADQRVGIFESAARQAMLAGDDAYAQSMAQNAQRERQGVLDNRTASNNANSAGQVDKASLGLKTNGATVPTSISTPIPGMQPPQSATPPAPIGAIPQGAIQMLRSNPHLASQFEAKYGAGSSKQILGQ